MKKLLPLFALLSLAACTPQSPGDDFVQTPSGACDGQTGFFSEPNGTQRLEFVTESVVLSFDAPSNPEWNADERMRDPLEFGHPRWSDAPSMGQRCDIVQDFSIQTLPQQDEAEFRQFVSHQQPGATMESLSIDGRSAVLVYGMEGVCPVAKLQIFTEQASIIILSSCEAMRVLGEDEVVRQVKEIARTIRFN